MNILLQQIYCDESGATGSDMMHSEQPFFSFASIAINSNEAEACVEKVLKDYTVQGKELKSRNPLKYNRGRKAISFVLDHYHDQILVSVFTKKYTLACKFFEYTFEPLIADASSIFYSVNFHKFIANTLYMYFRSQARYAEELFEGIERLLRELSDTSLRYLFSSNLERWRQRMAYFRDGTEGNRRG